MKGEIKQEKTLKLRSLSSKPRDHRQIKRKTAATKKAAAQAESGNAEAQAKNENAAAEAKRESTDAEAEEVEGTCTGTMVKDGVETTREASGRHPGHIVFHTEHVEHDMVDDPDAVEAARGTGEEHSDLSTVNEESGHIVGEEHHARCAHSDEAGSVCQQRQVSRKKKTMKKQVRQQQQKRLRRYQRKTLKSEDSSRREETHPKNRNDD